MSNKNFIIALFVGFIISLDNICAADIGFVVSLHKIYAADNNPVYHGVDSIAREFRVEDDIDLSAALKPTNARLDRVYIRVSDKRSAGTELTKKEMDHCFAEALRCGHKKLVAWILQQGVDLDERDECARTPVFRAAYNLPMLQLLIDHGATIAERDQYDNLKRDQHGNVQLLKDKWGGTVFEDARSSDTGIRCSKESRAFLEDRFLRSWNPLRDDAREQFRLPWLGYENIH